MKELMAGDTTRAIPVSPQGSILWAEDNALASAMGRAEYSGRVCGMGVGLLPGRPTSRSSASCLTQKAAFNTQMNEMMKKWEEERRTAEQKRIRADKERRRTNERIETRDQMMEKMQKMIEDLARANASLVANTLSTLDTVSSNFVRVRSTVANPPG
jgi:hypothetical protein